MTIPASTNEFPKVIFVEGAAPGTPPSGMVYAYALSDSLMYWKDDTGTVHGPIATLDDIGAPSLALDDLTDVDAAAPATDDVLTWDGADWVAAAAAGGGGGGSVLDAPNFGDATGWTNVGSTPTVQFGSPHADFLYVTKTPPNSGTDAYFGAYRAWTPSAGDKRRAMVRGKVLTSATQACGIFVGNIASGKALLWEAYGAPPSRYHWRAMSSLTGSVNDADTGVQAGLDGPSGQAGMFGPFWLELEYTSNTSYQLRYSHDGFLWTTLVTNKAPDSAFTPDCWGVHVYAYGSTTPMQGLFQRWEEV